MIRYHQEYYNTIEPQNMSISLTSTNDSTSCEQKILFTFVGQTVGVWTTGAATKEVGQRKLSAHRTNVLPKFRRNGKTLNARLSPAKNDEINYDAVRSDPAAGGPQSRARTRRSGQD